VAQLIAPLVTIVGETASGKSALSLYLAQHFNGEIICADAWTVRRSANIGTAKPSPESQKLVRHHLLDVIGPNKPYDPSRFKESALKVISDVTSRDKLPIMVGGSGLYIDSVLYDYSFLPTISSVSRTELNKLSKCQLLEKIQKESIDYSNLDINNRRRLIRALETKGQVPVKTKLRKNCLVIGIMSDRESLISRVTERVDHMISAGLQAEVFSISRDFGWDAAALKGIGYSEWHNYFKGQISLEEVRMSIIKDTLNLAKRQRTWFKRNKSIHWINSPVNLVQVVDLVTTFLNP
jgi:tRNA dimethylallyltransferase